MNSLFVDSKGNCAEHGNIVVRPEYCDVKTLRTLFGITQTYAYELMVKGQVKTVLLRKSGNKQTRGKRLFDVESVRSFIKRDAVSLDRWAVAETARSPRAFSSTTMWHDARIPGLLKERFGSHFACVIAK